MKSAILLIIITLAAAGINAQQENTSLYAPKRVRYHQDILEFMNENDENRVDIFIQVPFKDIQFIRMADGYEGGYSVTVSIFSKDEETLLSEKMWSEKIKTASFEESSSKDNFNISFRSFELKPGNYTIKTTYMDKDSRMEFSDAQNFEVKDFSEKPALSDIMMISRKTVVDGQNKMIPNVSRNVLAGNDGVKLYFEIYSDSLVEYDIAFKITNKDGNVVHSSIAEQFLEDYLTKIYHEIGELELGLGKYNLTIELINKEGEILGSSTKEFRSRQRGLPLVIDDIDDVISQIVYIATPQEIEEMKAGKDELEKTKIFFDFWKSKDPSPGNEENEVFEEYFARIAFSNENFGHYVEGWRTDRGMVFITLGAPNNIDRHPFEYESKPYEIWYYYELNRSFTFIDETGFGDYRLITPFYRDSFRYRY